jgi:Mg2+/Co2+ transporter CorB
MLTPIIVVLAILVLVSALFSGAEAALFSLNQIQIRQFQAHRDRASRGVLRLLATPQKLLNTLLVGNTLVNVAITSVATWIAVRQLGERGVQIAVLLASLVILLVCEILPKTIAVNFPRTVSRSSSIPITLLMTLLAPLTYAMTAVAGFLGRAMRLPVLDRGSTRRVTATELRAALEDIDEEAGMSRLESLLVQNILDFSRTTAEEVMTPRIDIVAAPLTADKEQLRRLIADSKHARIPLHEGTIDAIVGFLPSREFLLDPSARIANLLRPVLIVPEKAPIDRIFHDLRKGRWRMAVVVNEYGETVGIITLEDLIEEVVGELHDEYEPSVEEILEVSPGVFEVRGRTSLADLGGRVEVDLPQEQAVTVNGFLCALHGGFPRPGAVLRWGSLEFEVLEVARHRIQKARVRNMEMEGEDA